MKCLDFSFHTFLARKTSLFVHKYPLQQSSECNRWARRLIWLLPQVQNGFTRFFCLENLIHTLTCDGQRPWVSVCAFLILTTIKMKNPAFHMSLNLLVNENCCFILWFRAAKRRKNWSITQTGAPQPVKNALSCRSRKKGADACYNCGYEQCFQTNQFGNNKSNTHYFFYGSKPKLTLYGSPQVIYTVYVLIQPHSCIVIDKEWAWWLNQCKVSHAYIVFNKTFSSSTNSNAFWQTKTLMGIQNMNKASTPHLLRTD